MKKFMFAAIAIVAFTGVSLAKNGEVSKNTITTSLDPCVSVGFAASDAVYANGGTPQQATAAAEAAYNQCKKIGGGGKGLTPAPKKQ